MSIIKKFLILFSLIFIFTLGIALYIHHLYEKSMIDFIRQEEKEKQEAFVLNLEFFTKGTKTLAYDYTYWDEMVEFVKNKDQEWAKENLIPPLNTYNVDFIWVYNLSGDLVYFASRKEEIKDILPLPDLNKENLEKLFSQSPFKNYFLRTKYGLLEISSATIHPTFDVERKTPAQGYFFTAKLWDQNHLDNLKKINGLNVVLDYLDTHFVLPSSKFIISVSYPLKDQNEKTIGFLRGWQKLEYLETLNQHIRLYMAFLSIFSILFFLIVILFLRFWVIKSLVLTAKIIRTKDEGYLRDLKPHTREFLSLKESIAESFKKDGMLLEEIKMRKEAEEKTKRISRLYYLLSQINQLIMHTDNIDKLFREVCRFIVEEGGYRMCWIGLVDKTTKTVKPVVWWGYVDGYLDNIKISIDSDIPEGRGISGEIIRSGKYFVCNDIENASYMEPWKKEALKRNYRATAGFPLRMGMEVIGVLRVYASEVDFFTEEEIKLLNELAGDLSFAIEYLKKEEEKKKKDEELKDAYEKLKNLQAQLVQSAKLASLGQLSAGVAHEINNPLVGVLNNVQLLKLMLEEKKEIPSDELKEILSSIEEAGLRCKKIVQNMLSFSRASTKAFEQVSLNDIVENTVGLIENEYKLQNVLIERKLKSEIPLILGDRQLLQQALLDLLNNSLWAIKKKGNSGTITLTTDYEVENKIVVLLISDTGIGIPKENLEHIFEPFFTTKEIGEGTGLGLAIVYDIIKRHAGTVEVESQVNVGTTFRIKFPV